MADGAANEIARCGAPRAAQHPGERHERKGEVRCGDGEQTEERDGRGGVPAGPKVDRHVGEWRGEEGEIEERG